ncbi:hypothetical protein ABS768_17740, partial [Flavobacterium sp. ST-75]
AATAIAVTEKALAAPAPHRNSVDVNDLQLCLAMMYTQQSDKKALKVMNSFNHTDSWYEKRMGMVWAIRKALLAIIILAEFEYTELALSQLKSFKKRYKKYLLEVKENRVMQYALLVEKYLLNTDIIKTPGFKAEVLGLLKPDEKEDLFVLGFTAWLLSKTNQKPVYHTTLELLHYNSPSHS